jgi:hypothetical protein
MRLKFLNSGDTSKNYRKSKIQIPSFMLAKNEYYRYKEFRKNFNSKQCFLCLGENVART